MATLTLPPNNRAVGNTAHTADHNLLVDAITAVNNEAISLSSGISSFNAQTGTAYTLVLSDAGKMIELDNAAAITLTVPSFATVPFANRTRIDILQTGAGQVTVAGTAGVTVNARIGLKLQGQWTGATLLKRGTDFWVLLGALTS